MARLSHPHAVAVHDARIGIDAAFIEMEYVKGQSLNRILTPGVPMPLAWTARILEQLCDVLQEAHSLKIVHRDLKPANLMLVDGRPPGKEQLKVLDFGIAKILEGDLTSGDCRTNTGCFIGSAPWSSPEQASDAPIDGRSDLYSVGVILYEFLTGHRPFSGPITRVLLDHLSTPPPPFAERNPNVVVPPEIERVVMRCLAKNPDDRPQSAHKLAEELAAAFDRSLGMPSPDRAASDLRPMVTETLLPVPKPDRGDVAIGGSSTPRMTLPPEWRDLEIAPADQEPPAQPSTDAEESGPDTPPGHTPLILFLLRRVIVFVVLIATGGLAARFIPQIFNPPQWRPDGPPPLETEIPVPVPPKIELVKVAPFEVMRTLPDGYKRDPGSKLVLGLPEAIVREEDKTRFVRYSDRIYLPEGYESDSSERVAGWPRIISRNDTRYIRIAEGKFRMGVLATVLPQDQDKAPKDQPVPMVKLPGYYLQEAEVTNGELDAYFRDLKIDAADRPSLWREAIEALKKAPVDPSHYPAVGVTHDLAERYARWVGGRLPTEAQWEYAARSGGKSNRYVWGNEEPQKEWANIDQYHLIKTDVPTAAVLSFPRDRTEQGIYDMTGNVREWCRAVRMPNGEPQSPAGGTQYVIRGRVVQWVHRRILDDPT